MIFPPDEPNLAAAAETLRRGGLVAIPTETVYGLAANAYDADAVAKIFVAKGRAAVNPLIVHVAGPEQISRAAQWPLEEAPGGYFDALRVFWPGPLTLVLPKNDRVAKNVTPGLDTVAVRVPAHPVALRLLELCDFPLAAPSANVSLHISPTTAEHVQGDLGDSVEIILDGGPCEQGIESTIVTLAASPPRLLRHGAVPAEVIAERLALDLATLLRPAPDAESNASALPAPGMLSRHYAPRTRLVLADALRGATSEQDAELPHRVGLLLAGSWPADIDLHPSRFVHIEQLGLGQGDEANSMEVAARQLYAALRRLDEARLDLVIATPCAETGLGRAIMDRLRRAASGGWT